MPKGYPRKKAQPQPQPQPQPQGRVYPQPQEDDAPALPAHMSLDTMSQPDLASFSMRSFGRRPDESRPLPEQAEQVKQWMRGNSFQVR